MKLQINYHTIYTVIKRITLLMLFFLCTLSCYSNDNLSQLEVKQRKGNMLIKLHNNNDTTSRLEFVLGTFCLALKNVESKTAFLNGKNRRF